MDRETIKGAMRFLDTANMQELAAARENLEAAVRKLPAGSDARKDYQFLLRKLKEEQAARITGDLIARCRSQ